MTYDQALNYIHGISNFFCKPGLDRIKELCSGLGNPQEKLKFIHVAGTNGKGSFCSMTDSVLRSAGYKVGLYTSPFVLRFNERIRVDGENISDNDLAELTERVKAVAEKMSDKPTEFELITAIAFLHFASIGCDIVVLEAGMGGRLDATNIIKSPILSVVTGVDIDHTAFLGDTIEKIAFEKAGIIKSGVPVLYGGESREAEEVINAEAKKQGAELFKVDYDRLQVKKYSLSGSEFDYKDRQGVSIRLLGSYQPRNAAVVLDALDILRENGLKIPEDAVTQGLEKAKWAARFEIIRKNPTVIFDGAHNAQGISSAVESIERYFDKKVVIFTGVLRDKDYMKIAESLSRVASHAFTVTPDNPRALKAEEYGEILKSMGVDSTPCDSIAEAVKLGISVAEGENTALCCLGSLYTYKDVVDAIKG